MNWPSLPKVVECLTTSRRKGLQRRSLGPRFAFDRRSPLSLADCSECMPVRCASLRALIVSATWVALSLATHLIGTGAGVHHVSVFSVLGLLMITVLLTLVVAGLSGRRWTLGRSLVALALGQVGLHTIFTVLLTSPPNQSPVGPVGGSSMVLAHAVAALLIGVGIAVSDSALDTYFCVALSRVGSGLSVWSPWRLAGLIPGMDGAGAVARCGPR